MRPAFRSAGICIAIFAMMAACGPKRTQTRDILIKLDWNVDGVPITDGHGLFTTDLGYAVEADTFEVTTYSFELVPCDKPPSVPPGAPPPRKTSLSFIGTAWAGHRVGHPPTLTTTSRVEAPLQTHELDFDTLLHIPDVAYCSGHYLIARLPEEVADASDSTSIGISLRVHGRFRKSDSGDWSTFAVESSVAHGILVDLKPERSAKGVLFKNNDSILITRRLDHAFNGVDFPTMASPEIARQILRDLVAGTILTHRQVAAG